MTYTLFLLTLDLRMVVLREIKLLLFISLIYIVLNCQAKLLKSITDPTCYPDEPINDLRELESCENIEGSLIFESIVTGQDANVNIKTIHGCVYIENTNLKRLPFDNRVSISDCYAPEVNSLVGNRQLCLEDHAYLKTLFNVFEPVFEKEDCPLCDENNTHICVTMMGNFNLTSSNTLENHSNIKRINGILKVENITNAAWFDTTVKRLTVANLNTPDPAVVITNSAIPSNDFLLKLNVKTYGTTAVAISIPAYVIPRHIYLKMKADSLRIRKTQTIDASVEGPTDCYYSQRIEENPYAKIEETFYCEAVYGTFHIDSKDIPNLDKYRTKWIDIHTDAKYMNFTGDDDLIAIFKQQTAVNYVQPTFALNLHLKKYCYHAELINYARKWFKLSEQHRLKVLPDPACTTAHGDFSAYDLRHEKGDRLQHIIGTLIINKTSYDADDRKYASIQKRDTEGFSDDFARFKALTKITKRLDNPVDFPALTYAMCGFKYKIPSWISAVNLESQRQQDMLLSIDGPGYKMKLEDYEKFKQKFGARRLRITPMLSGECHFDAPISDLSQLNGCDGIVGDLVIRGRVKGNTSAIIKYVTGCITITNSTLENIDFLQFEVPYNRWACMLCAGSDNSGYSSNFEIKNNPLLCVDHVPFGVPRRMVENNNKNCGNALKDEEVQSRNFLIYGIQNTSELPDWNHVKEIRGRIVITGCTFPEFNLFPNLTRIVYRGIGPGLVIENNPNLTDFQLPKLQKVVMFNNENAIVIKNNPMLNITNKDKKFFQRVAGNRKVVYDKKKVKVVEEVRNETITSSTRMVNIGIGAGIGGAVVVIALYVSFLLIEYTWSTRSNKKKKATDEDFNKAKNKKSHTYLERTKDEKNKVAKGKEIRKSDSNVAANHDKVKPGKEPPKHLPKDQKAKSSNNDLKKPIGKETKIIEKKKSLTSVETPKKKPTPLTTKSETKKSQGSALLSATKSKHG